MTVNTIENFTVKIDPSKLKKDVIGFIGIIEVEDDGLFKTGYETVVTDIKPGEALAASVFAEVQRALYGPDAGGRASVQRLFQAIKAGDHKAQAVHAREIYETYNLSSSFMVVLVDKDGLCLERAPREIEGATDMFSARRRFREGVESMGGKYLIVHPED